jgi:hypothetical protein
MFPEGEKIMLEQFSDDFNWMLRNKAGYCPWVEKNEMQFSNCFFYKELCYQLLTPLETTQRLVRLPFQSNPLLDIFFKSLIRAEIRLISRYVPQRSNEERLTGHFVSEIDNSVHVIKDVFSDQSKLLYNEEKMIDFFYMDLSKGGKIEKTSGADLGFILVVDLPDYPFLVKSIIFQAKKINGSSVQIDRTQFNTLKGHHGLKAAYLFYDMNLQRQTSPLVNLTETMTEDLKGTAESPSLEYKNIVKGKPFSLFVIDMIRDENIGKLYKNFDKACDDLYKTTGTVQNLGIVSLGRSIKFLVDEEKTRNRNNDEPQTENVIKLSI